MAGRTNKDKEQDPEIDKILEQTPPDINEPIAADAQESEVAADALADPENEEPQITTEPATEPEADIPTPVPVETPEAKEQRYKSQQTEAQIQAEKNRSLITNLEKASQVGDPTTDELKTYVRADGVDWDELTTFEQAMAKKTYISEKRSESLSKVVEDTKRVDDWATKIEEFIDTTDGKPQFIELSSHESEFRKFAMKEAHRNAPVEILLSAFLHNLPVTEKKKGSMFESGGGGDKIEVKSGMTDADQVANLRKSDPREYARQLKAGQIKLEI